MIENTTVNLSYLVALCDGDDDFMNTIIASFVSEMPELIDSIRQKMKEGDWKSVGELAHKMKPSVQFVGMDDTVEHAKRIERFCREENVCPDQVTTLVDVVTEKTEEAVTVLRAVLSES